jgi:hypothetical protein
LRHAKFSFVTAQLFFALLSIELRPPREPATVQSREERPDSIEPDFFTHSGRSFNHWQSPARYEKAKEGEALGGLPTRQTLPIGRAASIRTSAGLSQAAGVERLPVSAHTFRLALQVMGVSKQSK